MITANSTAGWNTNYTYDGWGNLTGKGGSQGAPYLNNPVNPASNGSPGAAGFPYLPPTYYNGGSADIWNPYDVEGREINNSATETPRLMSPRCARYVGYTL